MDSNHQAGGSSGASHTVGAFGGASGRAGGGDEGVGLVVNPAVSVGDLIARAAALYRSIPASHHQSTFKTFRDALNLLHEALRSAAVHDTDSLAGKLDAVLSAAVHVAIVNGSRFAFGSTNAIPERVSGRYDLRFGREELPSRLRITSDAVEDAMGADLLPNKRFRADDGTFAPASARATESFRDVLARLLGSPELERELSAALWADGAAIAGSSVLAGALLVAPSWTAGDVDIWTTQRSKHVIAALESVAASRRVAPLLVGYELASALNTVVNDAGYNWVLPCTTSDALSGVPGAWDGPTAAEARSAMVRAVVTRHVASGAGGGEGFEVQLIMSSFDTLPVCVGSFDLTCCMAAYDGKRVWARAADLTSAGELTSPHSTALNAARLRGATYLQLMRTAGRVDKYARRGIACAATDAAALRASMRTLVRDPLTLAQACAYGRFTEAIGLVEAGAHLDPLSLGGDCIAFMHNPAPPIAGCSRCKYESGWRVFNVCAHAWNGHSINSFRAGLLELAARRVTPRARAANAAALLARSSKWLSRFLHAVPNDELTVQLDRDGRLVPDDCIGVIVECLTGWRGGTFAAAVEGEAADEAAGGRASRAAALELTLPAIGSAAENCCGYYATCCQNAYWV